MDAVQLGRLLAILLIQLLCAIPVYLIVRKRLSASMVSVIVFAIVYGAGVWSDARIIANTKMRDFVEEEVRAGALEERDSALFAAAMLHSPEYDLREIYRQAAAESLYGALAVTLAVFFRQRKVAKRRTDQKA